MLYLRLFLAGGLLLHKAVWEVMKKDSPAPARAKAVSPLKRMVKAFKALVLAAIFIQTLFFDILPISDQPLFLRTVGILIYVLGLGIALAGRIQLGRNWANLEDYQVLNGQRLVDRGIYRWIRHPIYTGDLLLLVGLQLALNSWLVLFTIPLAFVIFRQTLAEEEVLAQSFPEYPAYRQRSKMFIPFVI